MKNANGQWGALKFGILNSGSDTLQNKTIKWFDISIF